MINSRGFTLVEIILYTALIGIVLSGFISFSLIILANQNKNIVIEEVNNENRALHEMVVRELRWAKSINNPSLGIASSGVSYVDQDDNTDLIFAQNNSLVFYNSNESYTLNSPKVEISNAQFTNLGEDSILFSWSIASSGSSSKEFYFETDHESAATILNF